MIKLIDILNELEINKPISSLYDIVDKEGNGWWNLQIKHPENFLRDLKRVCLISSSKYGKYLDNIYKKGTYCITDESNINNADSQRFGKVNYNRIIKILNHLKIDYSNAKILYGLKFYESWTKNIAGWDSKRVQPSYWISIFMLDDIIFFNKDRTSYVLTPSKKIVKITDINLGNSKDKKTITKTVNNKHQLWRNDFIVYDIDEQNHILKFNAYYQDKLTGTGEITYIDQSTNTYDSKSVILEKCKVLFQSNLGIEEIKFNTKEIYLYRNETQYQKKNELGGMWQLNDKIQKLLVDKEKIAQNIQPVDDEEEIRKWINEINEQY